MDWNKSWQPRIILHLIYLHRKDGRNERAEHEKIIGDNTRYCSILFPILFVFTSLLGIIITAYEVLLFPSFVSVFYLYIGIIFVGIDIVLLMIWSSLRKKVREQHEPVERLAP